MASSINASTSGAGGVITSADNSGILNIQTAGTTAITVDASQNVGIGTSSPNLTTSNKALTINASTVAGFSALELSSGGTLNCFLQTNNAGTYFGNGAATPLQFYTNSAERMRIDSSGNLLQGTTNTNPITAPVNGNVFLASSGGMRISQSSGATYFGINGASGTQINFYTYTGGTALAGYISCPTSTTTAYTSVSDYRLKDNVVPMTGALDKVSALKPVTYDWKIGGSSQGFIAHELQEICPEAVVGEKDAVDAEGNPVYQGIDTSFLVATLVAAIQEQQAIITQLQADVAALKGTK